MKRRSHKAQLARRRVKRPVAAGKSVQLRQQEADFTAEGAPPPGWVASGPAKNGGDAVAITDGRRALLEVGH